MCYVDYIGMGQKICSSSCFRTVEGMPLLPTGLHVHVDPILIHSNAEELLR